MNISSEKTLKALNRACTFLLRNDYVEDALKLSELALEIDPTATVFLKARVFILHELNHPPEEVLESWNKLLEVDETCDWGWFRRSTLLVTLGHFEKALESWQRARALGLNFARFWTEGGFILLGLQRYEEALKNYEHALEIDPEEAEAWNGKAVSLGKLGYLEETLDLLEYALELKPDFAEAESNKGCSLFLLGRYEKAAKALDRALEIDPRDLISWRIKADNLVMLDCMNRSVRLTCL